MRGGGAQIGRADPSRELTRVVPLSALRSGRSRYGKSSLNPDGARSTINANFEHNVFRPPDSLLWPEREQPELRRRDRSQTLRARQILGRMYQARMNDPCRLLEMRLVHCRFLLDLAKTAVHKHGPRGTIRATRIHPGMCRVRTANSGQL